MRAPLHIAYQMVVIMAREAFLVITAKTPFLKMVHGTWWESCCLPCLQLFILRLKIICNGSICDLDKLFRFCSLLFIGQDAK